MSSWLVSNNSPRLPEIEPSLYHVVFLIVNWSWDKFFSDHFVSVCQNQSNKAPQAFIQLLLTPFNFNKSVQRGQALYTERNRMIFTSFQEIGEGRVKKGDAREGIQGLTK